MDKRILSYLAKQRISVGSILQDDQTIHSATMHFAHAENPFRIYWLTGKATRKCRSLLTGTTQQAAVVIGFSEEEFTTFQAEGTVQLVGSDQMGAYFEKYPSRKESAVSPDVACLEFTPTWWAFHDYSQKTPLELAMDQGKGDSS